MKERCVSGKKLQYLQYPEGEQAGIRESKLYNVPLTMAQGWIV